jgi:hypothetical protein
VASDRFGARAVTSRREVKIFRGAICCRARPGCARGDGRALPCLGTAATSQNDCKSDLSSPIAAAPGELSGVGECLASVVGVLVEI